MLLMTYTLDIWVMKPGKIHKGWRFSPHSQPWDAA
jgi:hypothetical protein